MDAQQASSMADLRLEQLRLKNALLNKELESISTESRNYGEFHFVGGVTEARVARMIEDMAAWSKLNAEQPITLYINSQGGSVIDGFAFYDFLQSLRKKGHKITTVGLGLTASMGSVLLQAGDERVMSKHCWMLVHEVQGLAEGSFSEMTNVLSFNKRLQDQALDIYTQRGTWSRASFKKKWKDDMWLSAEDAIKAGLADRVEES